ncbi:PREDICTED: uncharacterized protein LOC106120709 isoform X2 [Papilio xuthus]|uniref:Uncharacterized protein LOC106120709 isoform X2 n=1 Tax=Papilio xuthus TaxID=66420 RepID=A0AAJ6ZFQ8_PAPXU|nr:PREDICTED: uncharacterized protein LOC106120709 isoform X2 [Papilio xuthus]
MDDYLLNDGDSESDGESEEELNMQSSEGQARVVMTRTAAPVKKQHFDKSLAASHSYMGGGLVPLRGRSVLEPGWQGRLPVAAHSGAVFPGETVPMLMPDYDDAILLFEAIQRDKLFGLLCPDETGGMVSGYGVVCEVYEAGTAGAGEARGNTALSFKARARHRFRLLHPPDHPAPLHSYTRAAAGGGGGAVLLGRLQPDAVGARPTRAVRGGRRAAAPALGAAFHRPEERAVLCGVRRGDSAARRRAAHVQRGRALQLHQFRRVHARHRDGVARARRGAQRAALRGVLLVPGLRLDHHRVRRLQDAPRLAVRRAEPQPEAGVLLRSVPQLRAAARRRRARLRVMHLCTYVPTDGKSPQAYFK